MVKGYKSTEYISCLSCKSSSREYKISLNIKTKSLMDMRKKIKGLTEAISAVLEANAHTPISLQYLYSEMMGGELLKLPESSKEVTYKQMRFKHSVRGIVKMLAYQGKISRVGRGLYQWISSAS